MIKLVILGAVLIYCAFVLKKIVKATKEGKCVGCTESECHCKDKKFL